MRAIAALYRHLGTHSVLVAVGLVAVSVSQEGVFRQRPAVSIDSSSHRYPAKVASVRGLDFKNWKYPVAANLAFQLHNGKLHKDVPSHTDVTLKNIWYFDSRALVTLDLLSCGGSCSDQHLLYLFAIEDGHPAIQQTIGFDVQVEGAGQWFDPGLRTLTVKARSDDGSAHCCPEHMDVVVFRWTGKKFEIDKSETIPVKSD